jgi:addiction module HigA family antidote
MTEHKITDPAKRSVKPGDPEHPGGWIRRNLLEPLGLSVAEAARRMDVNRVGLNNVLSGKHGVSADLAYKLEALTGVDGDLLIGMQVAYERGQNREKRERYAREIERVRDEAA